MVLKAIRKLMGGKPSTDFSDIRRNDPCPCGSGRKFKSCHFEQESARRREAGYSRQFGNRK